MHTRLIFFCLAIAIAAGASAQDPASSTPGGSGAPGEHAPFFAEPAPLRKGVEFVAPYLTGSSEQRGSGVYASVGNLVTGAGWLSAGPGYRQWFGNRTAFVDGSAEVSLRGYLQALARVEAPRLAGGRVSVGAQLVWNDLKQVHYFGIGPDAPEVDSAYRIKTTDMTGYVRYQVTPVVSVDAELGWLAAPILSTSTGWLDPGYPDTQVVFPDDPGVGVPPPSYRHGAVGVTIDTRDSPAYATRGGLLRAAMSQYADLGQEAFGFRHVQLEALQFLPLVPGRWTLVAHGWGVLTDAIPGQVVAFYMLPTIGGGNTLRGDRNYRWHDQTTLVVNVESRFDIFEHLDLAAFVDAGTVAQKVQALDMGRVTYGAGVRLHTRTATLVRIDVGHSREQGWGVIARINDPLRLERLSRRGAAIPFVP